MKTDFHNKDFALSLDLKWRLRSTRKWPIRIPLIFSHTQISRYFSCTIFNTPQRKKNRFLWKYMLQHTKRQVKLFEKQFASQHLSLPCVLYISYETSKAEEQLRVHDNVTCFVTPIATLCIPPSFSIAPQCYTVHCLCTLVPDICAV